MLDMLRMEDTASLNSYCINAKNLCSNLKLFVAAESAFIRLFV
jgi:hypothetical protein